ncbi:mediator of RNA polymerase II transcription subunit 11 [Drosophila grimshawi]|uniref:Mediator of RNA polymerase II transcription subunit 11 n=1 Tax=Drosophila grimshawi TaxID=7222 RepID=B4J1T9_DROGR|nr:mediator of RNA polymerase II transcription subunit 11 [Drosophila grimshawi]EDV98019.1 GH14372 [Drosophila grimshawi]
MNPLDKIHALDEIEKDIILCMQSAGQALQELGKEKSSQKSAETQSQQFLKSLSSVESKLSEQINYLTQVSTGQPHEGSGYASAKVLQMAWHRIQHARSRVRELEETKAKHSHAARQQQKRQQEHAAAQQQQQAAAAAAAQQHQQHASGGGVAGAGAADGGTAGISNSAGGAVSADAGGGLPTN